MILATTMTAYRRPAYTGEVLTALTQCDGIADWILLPNVEPGHEEVIAAYREWNASEVRLLVNRELRIPEVKSDNGHQILLASGYNKPKSEPLPEPSRAMPARPARFGRPWAGPLTAVGLSG